MLVGGYDLAHHRPDSLRPAYLIPAGYRFVVATDARGKVIHFLKFRAALPKRSLFSAPKPKSGAGGATAQQTATTNLNTNLVAKSRAGQASLTGAAVLDPAGPTQERLFFLSTDPDLPAKVARWHPLPRRPEVAAGTVILPVNMRLSPFDFSRDFALGLTVGPRWRISHYQEPCRNACLPSLPTSAPSTAWALAAGCAAPPTSGRGARRGA